MPDHEPWRAIDDPGERLTTALDQVYGYYAENEPMLSNVTRDAEIDALTRELAQLRFGPVLGAMHDVLSKDVPKSAQALIGLSLQFTTWRSLVRDSGLSHDQAVDTMAGAVVSLSASGVPRKPRRRRSAAPRQASAPRKPVPR